MSADVIRVVGACHHNLKNLDLELPVNELIVISALTPCTPRGQRLGFVRLLVHLKPVRLDADPFTPATACPLQDKTAEVIVDRIAVQPRHPDKSAWWVSEKDWHPRQGQWRFKTTDDIKLAQHRATAIRRHTKVAGTRSPYDGDWVYWVSRMGRHPEIPRKWAILLKRQGGRCSWCGLYFKHGEDLLELDHIIPKSEGAMVKPPTYNCSLDMAMTSRPRRIERSKVLVTRARFWASVASFSRADGSSTTCSNSGI